jgi:cytochrome c-type biogenesis protein
MPDVSAVGISVVFLAGIVSFLSPCVLPLVPGYVSYIAGGISGIHGAAPDNWQRLRTVGFSLCFILGFSTVFIALGASASAVGQLLLGYRTELNIVGGIIVIGFGLFMLGMVPIQQMQSEFRFHLSLPGGRPLSAYVLGLAFGFGWTPCIGPILGAILTANAASAEIGEGMILLAIYSAGLGVPFVLAALFTNRLLRGIRASRGVGRWLYQIAGVVMIAMGIAMITDKLSAFSYWLLDVFPILRQIG